MGYKIPIDKVIVQTTEPTNPPCSAKDMNIAIDKLISLGAISPCDDLPSQFISPIFLTPKSTGGYRFILNLKKFNKSVNTYHFKMEDIRTVLKLISKNAYMATIDLKEAYFLVPVHPTDRKYLRFWFKNLFEFNCLPFGLCTAPLVFTKLLKPLLARLRSQGHTLVAYLDDIICIGPDSNSCKITVNTVLNYLNNLGFVVNFEKSNLNPKQTCKFLGVEINSTTMSLQLPSEKIEKIIKLVKIISSKSSVSIRDFAKFIGTLTAACHAVAYGWVYTKYFEREKYLALKNSGDNYDAKMIIKPYLHEDFLWWLRLGHKAKNPIRHDQFNQEIFTDASLSGWGAACDGEIARGHWSIEESKDHINLLELRAAFLGLKSFCRAQNNTVLLRIDNTTAIAYIN